MNENTQSLGSQNAPRPNLAPRSATSTSAAANRSVIGPTLVVRGEVTAEEDLLVRGRIEGTIDHNQTLNVHREGTVEAVVRAKEIHVEGTVKGDLFGTQRVNVCETGKVVGNVVAPRVGVSEGAHFKGMVDMVSDTAAIERRYQEQTGKANSKAAGNDRSDVDGDDDNNGVSAKSGKNRGSEKSAADGAADKASADKVSADKQDKPETAADKQSGAAAS